MVTRRKAIGMTPVVIIVVIVIMIGTVAFVVLNSPKSVSATTSSTWQSSVAALPLWMEGCDTAYPNQLSTCSVTTAAVGSPETFAMTTGVNYGGLNPITLHEQFFGVQVSRSDTLQFTFTGSNATDFQVYMDNRTGANPDSLASEVGSYRLDTLVNESGVDYFSGQIHATQPGLYIFVFSVLQPEPGNTISFLLRDTDAYQGGTISVGPVAPEEVVMHTNHSETGGAPWAKFPLTIYSNTTTSVNMTAVNVPSGAWIKFVPSYLPAVGPKGANVTMYEAGLSALSEGGNRYNTSLFIDANGPNGVLAETYLPLDGSGVSSIKVLNSPNMTSAENQWGTFGANANTTTDGEISVVYDPFSASGSGSLSLNLTIAGILQDGETVPFPTGLQVYWPSQIIGLTGCCAPYVAEYDNFTGGAPSKSFQVTLPVDYPFYFEIGIKASSLPIGNQYTIVLEETVNGQSFLGYLSVIVEPPLEPI